MGVIKRQGLKNTIVSYAGVAIAAFSTIFIYPNDRETYGLVQFLIGTGLFLMPLLSIGSHSVIVRFFPEFRDKDKGHNGILGMTSLMTALGSILFFVLYCLFEESIFNFYSDKPKAFQSYLHAYLPLLIPLSCLIAFFHLFYYYCSNFGRIAIPSVFQNAIKVVLPILIFFHYNGYISVNFVIKGVLLNYVVVNGAMLFYIFKLGQWYWKPKFSFLNKARQKEIFGFAFFGMVITMGSALSFRIDSFMIPSLIDFKDNGTYSISLFIGNAIAIPSTALIVIASPIISESFQKNDLQHINFIYQKSSINLFLIGLYFFSGILLCVEDLFDIMPNGDTMQNGILVVLLIGLAKLVDMVTSVNNQIIAYSSKYIFGVYAIVVLAICNVFFNLLFIPIYGIIGAALATFLSISIYNVAKLIFIYINWRMQPFSLATIKSIAIAIIITLPIYYLPLPNNPIIRILSKGVLLTAVFFPLIYYLELSKDINGMIRNALGLKD